MALLIQKRKKQIIPRAGLRSKRVVKTTKEG